MADKLEMRASSIRRNGRYLLPLVALPLERSPLVVDFGPFSLRRFEGCEGSSSLASVRFEGVLETEVFCGVAVGYNHCALSG
jgi:hypothetical protein